MKVCSLCGLEKHETEFRVRVDRPCGYRSNCKSCDLICRRSKNWDKRYRLSPKGKLNTSKGGYVYQRTPGGRLVCQQKCRRRRERKQELDLKLTKEDVAVIYTRFHNACFNCSSTQNLQIDHHYPLAKGYGLSLDNAVLLCRSCNSSKHDRMPEEFYSQDQLADLIKLLVE